MARQPASRGASRRPGKGKQGMSPWSFVFMGVVIGLFVAFLFHLAVLQKQTPGDASNQQAKASKPAAPKDRNKKAEGKPESNLPKFDFYAVLPQMEVVLPRSEAPETKAGSGKSAQTQAPSNSTQQKAGDTKAEADQQGQFLLQAGSFRDKSSAEQLRAEFILQGFDASVQPGVLASGDTWYRVMIGPFTSKSSMRQAQDRLSALNVETLAIQVKGT